MFKRYSFHLIKSNKTMTGIFSFICFVVFPLFVLLKDSKSVYTSYVSYIEYMGNYGLTVYAVLMCIGICVLPIISYMFNYSKKSVDVYYSLPIRRKDLFSIHYFIPFVVMFIIVLFNYFIGLCFIGFNEFNIVLEYMIKFLSISICCFAGYSINTYFILKCNTLVDSIIITLCINLIPFILWGSCNLFLRQYIVNIGIDVSDYIKPILYFSSIYNCSVVYDFMNNTTSAIILSVMAFVSVIMSILACRAFIYRKGEDASQITSFYFTYPFIINVLSICILSLVDIVNYDSLNLIISLSFIFVVFSIMNFIANRKVKLTFRIAGKFVLFIVLIGVLSYSAVYTDCFGINTKLVENYSTVTVHAYVYDNEKDVSYNYEKVYTKEDIDKIDEIQNLQLLAAKQHKEGTYLRNINTHCHIDVNYRAGKDTEYRSYTFEYEDVSHILENLDKTEY